jgi:hypothetical protein
VGVCVRHFVSYNFYHRDLGNQFAGREIRCGNLGGASNSISGVAAPK